MQFITCALITSKLHLRIFMYVYIYIEPRLAHAYITTFLALRARMCTVHINVLASTLPYTHTCVLFLDMYVLKSMRIRYIKRGRKRTFLLPPLIPNHTYPRSSGFPMCTPLALHLHYTHKSRTGHGYGHNHISILRSPKTRYR